MKELMRLCLTYIDHFSSLQKLIPVFIENLVPLLSKKTDKVRYAIPSAEVKNRIC